MSIFLVKKKRKRNSLLNGLQNFLKNLTVYFLVKKVHNKLIIVELFTKRNNLSVQWIAKTLTLSILFFTKVKEIENCSADYQTKEIIF